MATADSGERYAWLFRKAGAHLARGNVARAVEVLKDGRALAEQQGNQRMARLFEAEIERAKEPPV